MPDSSWDDKLKKVQHGIKPDGETAAEPQDADALTLADMNGEYATLRAANKLLTRLHIIDKAGKVFSFQYHHLDSHSVYDGGKITLVFVGAKHWEISAKGQGPDVWKIYDYITLHRWPYLREASGSMPGAAATDKDTVFTEITIKDVTPRPEA